jgi:hypothetical protein
MFHTWAGQMGKRKPYVIFPKHLGVYLGFVEGWGWSLHLFP